MIFLLLGFLLFCITLGGILPPLRLLVPPLVGATIGYVTNVLAVWMIFNPKRPVLGYQGIVPRSKRELARRLGEVIERELINPDSIANLLRRKEEQIKEGIVLWLLSLLKDNRKFKDLLDYDEFKRMIVEFYLNNVNHLPEALADGIDTFLEETIEGVVHSLYDRINDVTPLNLSERSVDVAEKLLEGALKLLKNRETAEILSILIEKTLRQSQRGTLEGLFLSVVGSGYLRKKLSEVIVTLPKVYAEDYALRSRVRGILRGYLSRPLRELVPPEALLDLFKDLTKTIKVDPRKFLVSKGSLKLLDEILEALGNMSPATLAGMIGTERLKILLEDLVEGIWPLIFDLIEELVSHVDVKGIVVEKVESYSVEEMEDLILGFMKREFRFVEYMGIPIGALVGLINLLIGM
ncbi:MAG: DUF445 family protein [Thermotogae bacterium]|nr:DUF445 family protein [Thermotogota bacterium]